VRALGAYSLRGVGASAGGVVSNTQDLVVTNTTNLFPSPVGDLGVLRGTLQAIGGV
jgi:hypothetical protein